jgi:hypothetical protein
MIMAGCGVCLRAQQVQGSFAGTVTDQSSALVPGVTVTATDTKGNVTSAWTVIRVTEPPTKVGFGDFGASLETLMVRVVEGMAELAVVVLPIALVAVAVVYPFRRRAKVPKEIRQS